MWQIITIVTLLLLMFSRQFFDLQTTVGAFDPDSLTAIGFIILAAFTMGELFRRAKFPALLGYITAGIVFGPELTQLVFGTTDQAIFGHEVIEDLSLIHILIVGVIGTMGGGELKIADLKAQAGTILTVVPMIFVSAVPLSGATALGLSVFFPETVPFLADTSMTSKMAAALLFGVFGFAMSPTVTLAIMQETRSKGPFTLLTLSVVIVGELMLVASFLLMLNFAQLLMSPEGFAMSTLLASLPSIGAEFGWALIIGLVTGIVFILYLRFVAREMLLFTVGIIFGAATVGQMVHAEQLLTFLVAGFVVQNFSKQGHDMIHALEKLSVPVFVIYFMTEAATLDLTTVAQFLPLVLALTASRAIAIAGATKMATRLRDDPDYIDSNLWLALFPLGSVDIVLAGMVAERIEPWGEDFRAVIIAVVVIHIVVAPIILKWILGRAGETKEAREAGSEEVAELDRIVSVDQHEVAQEPLERPEFPDERLNRRLEHVNEELTACYQTCLHRQIEQHGQRLEHMMGRINQVRQETIDDLVALLDQAAQGEPTAPEDLAPRVKQLHVQFRQAIQPQIDLLEHIDPMPVTTETTDRLLDRVHGLVDFDEQYRVRMEPWLLESDPDDSRWLGAVKAARRLRRGYGRGGHRTVPVGRLWRFYLVLSLPAYLASAVAATAERNEAFWQQFGLHLRHVDDLFEKLVRTLRAPAEQALVERAEEEAEADTSSEITVIERGEEVSPSVDALPMSMSTPTTPGDADQVDHDAEADADTDPEDTAQAPEPTSALERARAITRRRRQELDEEADTLDSRLALLTQTQRERFTVSIARAYDDFIDGVAKAGTIELPSFRYRPSSRYDDAHRAELRLKNRLGRETTLVRGYQGWAVLDHQLILFLHWFRTYQKRVVSSLETRFEDGCVRQLRRLKSRCEERPSALRDPAERDTTEQDTAEQDTDAHEQALDWSKWYSDQIAPALENARTTLDHALTDFSQGIITRRLMDVLEARVARFSEQVDLLVQHPAESVEARSGVETLSVPLRSWYFSKLLHESALRLVEFNERAERTLRRTQLAVSEVRQGLAQSLVVDQQEGRDGRAPDQPQDARTSDQRDDLARRGLQQAAEQLDELIDQLRDDEHQMRRWVVDETTQVARESTIPFLEHRLRHITHELNRWRGETLAQRSVRPIVSRLGKMYRRSAPIFEQITSDLGARLAGQERVDRQSQVRERLLRADRHSYQELPPLYRRVFSPVPIDIPDFYVERPAVEQECIEAVERWFHGGSSSILIVGDRGMGKRTLVHHVLPLRLFSKYREFSEDQLQTVRIDEQVDSEADLCASFAPLFDGAKPQSLRELVYHLERTDQRRIIFVENGDKVFSRTRDGLARCERFLDVIEQTSDQILWVILMGKPAATLLDTAIGLSDYFTHPVEVSALSPLEIEQMIMARHDVSGFELSFEQPEVRYLDRLLHPLRASEALRHPRKAYFERLGRLSGGNPLLALLYWLETVHLDPTDDSRIIVETLPEHEIELISRLSLQKQLVLATLVQHHALTLPRLSRILRVDHGAVRTELNHLQRLGFVEYVASTSTYQLRPLPNALVTQELRTRNLV